MKRFVITALACATLALVACSSAPIHFYTLLPPMAQQAATAKPVDYRIDVLPVNVPAQVDLPQLVVRQGDGQVALLEGEQWIAPLGNQIRSAVSSRLSGQLGTEDVHGLAVDAKVPVYRIKIDVRRFESVPGAYTAMDATWSVHLAGSKKQVLQCASHVRQPVAAGYPALVLGHQRGLQALADAIAGVVRSMAEGKAATCPV